MRDPEAPYRHHAAALLRPWCDLVAEADVRLRDGSRGRVDLLALPLASGLSEGSIAFEMKAVPLVTDGGMAKWVKQAADYVQATPVNGWPPVALSLLWFGDIAMDEREAERLVIQGILQVAHQFRVGTATITRNQGLVLRTGPHDLFRERREGWTKNSEILIFGKRKAAGGRAPVQSKGPEAASNA